LYGGSVGAARRRKKKRPAVRKGARKPIPPTGANAPSPTKKKRNVGVDEGNTWRKGGKRTEPPLRKKKPPLPQGKKTKATPSVTEGRTSRIVSRKGEKKATFTSKMVPEKNRARPGQPP